jgi:uncharacterized membrane protein
MAKPPVRTKKRPNTAVDQTKLAVTAEQSHSQNGKQVAHIQQATFSGPMPPPALLEGYERIVPGAAERILAMAESDTKHQQEIEFAALRAAASEIKRGQIFGFVIGLTALGASIVALALGSPAVAGVIGGTTVVGLVSVFIIGRISKSE